MSGGERNDRVLAGEYVLGLLEGADVDSFERRLAREKPLQDEIAYWRARFSDLDATADAQAPSADLWRRIETSIGAPRAAAVAERPGWVERLWESLGFWRGASFAGAAASLMLAIAVGLLAGRATPQPVIIAVLQTDGALPGAIVEAFGDGSIVVVPLRDIEVPPGKALEVWTLYDKQRGPVSLGLIDRAERARFQTHNLPAREDQLYEITLEPATGSPIGRPTGPVLMKGLASAPRI
ncbi:MAG TPA: anti-sigma factor [Xanthobacteraceae bacterium]|nr:anti-sigma factor [Xanthobacteraceae bacterium]